jgi:hypothetical protein
MNALALTVTSSWPDHPLSHWFRREEVSGRGPVLARHGAAVLARQGRSGHATPVRARGLRRLIETTRGSVGWRSSGKSSSVAAAAAAWAYGGIHSASASEQRVAAAASRWRLHSGSSSRGLEGGNRRQRLRIVRLLITAERGRRRGSIGCLSGNSVGWLSRGSVSGLRGVGGRGGQAGVELVLLVLLVRVARLTLQRLERDRIRISELEVVSWEKRQILFVRRGITVSWHCLLRFRWKI